MKTRLQSLLVLAALIGTPAVVVAGTSGAITPESVGLAKRLNPGVQTTRITKVNPLDRLAEPHSSRPKLLSPHRAKQQAKARANELARRSALLKAPTSSFTLGFADAVKSPGTGNHFYTYVAGGYVDPWGITVGASNDHDGAGFGVVITPSSAKKYRFVVHCRFVTSGTPTFRWYVQTGSDKHRKHFLMTAKKNKSNEFSVPVESDRAGPFIVRFSSGTTFKAPPGACVVTEYQR